jgi:excisionase family DNA binding protein
VTAGSVKMAGKKCLDRAWTGTLTISTISTTDQGEGAPVAPTPRFLQLADVAEVLNISAAQVYALVRSGELPAIKIGGRGQWRVEATELEAYIQRLYADTKQFVAAHPFGRGEGVDLE